jgi:outer membrane protein OmpA-like peptidoglycan-associated protein
MREQLIDQAAKTQPLCFLSAHGLQSDKPSMGSWFDPVASVAARSVQAPSTSLHAAMLNCANGSQIFRDERSLLQLQRLYGNRHVRRVLGLSGQAQQEVAISAQTESAIGRGDVSRQAPDSSVSADCDAVRVQMGAQRGASGSARHAQRLQRICAECEEESRRKEVQPSMSQGVHRLCAECEEKSIKEQAQRSIATTGQPEARHEQEAGIFAELTQLGHERLGFAGLQRQADISKAPPGMKCIATAGHGHLPGTDILFGQSSSDLGGQKATIAAFARQWVADGSKDDVMVDGWASEEGAQELNWQLSCDRAEAVKAELIRQGVPDAKITTLAHGASTEFSAKDLAPNRRAIITRQRAVGPPPVLETISSETVAPTPGLRTRTTIGVGEEVNLTHAPGAAVWATTAGTLSAANGVTVKLTAPDTAQKVTVTAGTTSIVFDVIAPNDVHMDNFPGTGIKHTKDHADSGIETLPFLLPDNVNFYNVTYRELNVGCNTSGTYSCFGAGTGHCAQPSGGACADLAMTNTVAAGKGTQAVLGDCAYSGDCLQAAPQTPGMLFFAIPYEYKVGTGAYHQFKIVLQLHMLAPDFSTLMSSKAGAFGFTTVGAATSAIAACP